jgi:uncharacterized membrane protein YfcA
VRFYRSRFPVLDIRNTAIVTVTVGAILGVLVSISSVGAGAVGITALIILYPQLPMARIIGSDIAHAVPLTLIAGVGHWIIGTVDWHIIGSLLAGSLPGIILGSYLTVRVPEPAQQFVASHRLHAERAALKNHVIYAREMPHPHCIQRSADRPQINRSQNKSDE